MLYAFQQINLENKLQNKHLNMEVILPSKTLTNNSETTERTPLEFNSSPDNSEVALDKLGIPLFTYSLDNYVLLKDLSKAWNYPSSYQLISRLLKHSYIKKSDILTSNKKLNQWLLKHNLIDSKNLSTSLFYIKFSTIYHAISEKLVFFGNDEVEIEDEEVVAQIESQDGLAEFIKKDDEFQKIVTINQVFPQYGNSDTSQSHALFNTLTNVTKLSFYKSLSSQGYKFLPNNKLSIPERELLARDNDIYASIEQETIKQEDEDLKKKNRKAIPRPRKQNLNVDPNSLDLSESLIPGQGYIQEFSVNNLCKVPNYYIANTQPAVISTLTAIAPVSSTLVSMAAVTPATQGTSLFGSAADSTNSPAPATPRSNFNIKKLNSSSNSSFLFNDSLKTSKSVQQLAFSNDNDNHNHTKYYYTKTYRGPGSGNYKDASLMNKINKIRAAPDAIPSHKLTNQVLKTAYNRQNQSMKGLLHDKFSKSQIDSVLHKRNTYTEDYLNLEILHNNLQFNVLVNTYRSISDDSWKNYYKFKTTDFEQVNAIHQERMEILLKKQYLTDLEDWRHRELARKNKLIQRMQNNQLSMERREKLNLEKVQAKFQKERLLEENRRRKQLEATFNDPFETDDFDLLGHALKIPSDKEDESEDDIIVDEQEEEDVEYLRIPLQPPKPVETPHLDTLSRFTLPVSHPEIVHALPVNLRSINSDGNSVPAIKKIIRYVSTYGDASNPEFLNKIEIIKIPNPNSVAWDNLRKFKKD